MSNSRQVRVLRDGQEVGPYTVYGALELLRLGHLKHSDLYWEAGMAGWAPLSELRRLERILRQVRISRNGQEIGTFTVREAMQQLLLGQLDKTDLYWEAGMVGWAPLSQLSGSEIESVTGEMIEGSYVPQVMPRVEYVTRGMITGDTSKERAAKQQAEYEAKIEEREQERIGCGCIVILLGALMGWWLGRH